MAHGAGAEWNALVRETVSSVVWEAGPVATAFLMGAESGSAGWDAGIASLVGRGARRIIVVPLMVSSAGGHYRQLQHYVGDRATLPPELLDHAHHPPKPAPVPIGLTAAIDGAPELTAVLTGAWESLPAIDRRPAVVFVAHGPTDDGDAVRWREDLQRAVAPLTEAAGVRSDIGLLRDDAAPEVRAAAVAGIRSSIERLAAETGDSVTVLPVLVSRGSIGNAKIPSDLAGLPIRYVPIALAPSPHLARWIERVALASRDGRY